MFTHIILVLCWQATCVDNLINNSTSPPVCLRQCFILFATPETSSLSWLSLASAAEKHIPQAPRKQWRSPNDSRWRDTRWQVKSGDATGPPGGLNTVYLVSSETSWIWRIVKSDWSEGIHTKFITNSICLFYRKQLSVHVGRFTWSKVVVKQIKKMYKWFRKWNFL